LAAVFRNPSTFINRTDNSYQKKKNLSVLYVMNIEPVVYLLLMKYNGYWIIYNLLRLYVNSLYYNMGEI